MSKHNEFHEIINKIQDYVEKNKHAYIIPEHVFLILLDDEKCKKMIISLSTDENKESTIDSLKMEIENYIQNNIEKAKTLNDITPTSAYTRIMQSAMATSAMRQMEPNSLNIFVSLFNDNEQATTYFLNKHGITEDKVIEYVVNNRNSFNTHQNDNECGTLEQYAVNLNKMAQQGKIDPLIGRNKEIERIIQILAKKKSNNPIIVGTAGCITEDTKIIIRKVKNGNTPVKMIFD